MKENEYAQNKAKSKKKKKKMEENEFALSRKMHLTIDNMVIKSKCDINNILCRGKNNKIYCLRPKLFFVLHGIFVRSCQFGNVEGEMMPTKIIDHGFK